MTAVIASLGTRLRRQFLLLGVLPLLVLSAAAWSLLVPLLVAQAEARNRQLAVAIGDQVRLQLQLRERAAAMLADGLRNDPTAPGATDRALQALLLRDPFLQAAYITDAQGLVIHAALQEQSGRFSEDAVGLNLSGQPYYALARARPEPVWSDTFLSTLTGEVTAALALEAGEKTVLFELSLAAVSRSLSEQAQAGSAQVVVVDRAGNVVAHPDARQALQRESLSDLPIVKTAMRGTATSARTDRDGQRQLTHALPVMPVAWTVLVSQPVSAVMAPVLQLASAVAGALAAAVLIAVFFGWRMARQTGTEVARLADGAQRTMSEGATPVELSFTSSEFNAVWTRLRDLFQQLHQRDALTRAAQQDLQAVLDAATQVAIVATDSAGGVTVFNIGAQRMLGWESHEVVGRLSPLAWHDEAEVRTRAEALSLKYGQTVTGVEALMAEARHGGYEVRDWSFIRRDGRRLDVSLAVTAMRTPAGELKGFLAVAIDITTRRQAQALELARRTAELASQSKSNFLSKMSHELRTPLNAILGFAQLIEGDPAQPPTDLQRSYVQHIQNAGWHLVRLIDEVLDLARIESGHIKVVIGPVDLAAVLSNAAQMVQQQMRQYDVVFTMGDLPSGPAQQVAADETRLLQVLTNLLSNAAKYNRPGGTVRLECCSEGTRVRISVADTGRGMSGEQLAHLFEPFNRLGMETSSIEGTGIGLVITRHLVEMMDGRLEVSSQSGEGTTFVVDLPAAFDEAQVARGGPTPLTSRLKALGRIVYIEDNEVNATLMRAILRQRPGIECRVYPRADLGLEAIRASPPDLILLDMHLPDAAGEDVLATLRAEDRLRQIPVVVVSADATYARIEAALKSGVQAYVTKPLLMADTLAVVDRFLSRDLSLP
jgi:PAS domain S-box-containing protein